MLIIGRRVGESIFLGEDVEIRITDLTPSRVKLGIVAPKKLPILRGEVVLAQQHNRAAANAPASDAICSVINQLRSTR